LKKQLAFLLARNHIWFNPGPDESPEIDDCLRNLSVTNQFIHLATESVVKVAQSPDDIYKLSGEYTAWVPRFPRNLHLFILNSPKVDWQPERGVY
jgi:RPN1 N-terminal domain